MEVLVAFIRSTTPGASFWQLALAACEAGNVVEMTLATCHLGNSHDPTLR
jgi:hypothetical protein